MIDRRPFALRPHLLYRWYDVDQRLIYIGITSAPKHRFKMHRNWWVWKYVSTVELERFPDKVAAEVAEQSAIETEHPAFNVVHTPLQKNRPAGPHSFVLQFAPLPGARPAPGRPAIIDRGTGQVTTFAAALGATPAQRVGQRG